MQRQDEFLRSLMSIVDINLGRTTDYGLRLIRDTIERRLPLLKPVAYENDDLSRGLSGDGIHHICGDEASIRRVSDALHYQAAYAPYPMMHRKEQERRIAAEQALDKIRAIVTL